MEPALSLFFHGEKAASWNQVATKTFWKYKQLKDYWRELTRVLLLEESAKPISGPVRIEATAFFKGNRRHDTDNIFLKPILDELVTRGILPDDDSSVVREVELRAVTSGQYDALRVDLYALQDTA